MRFFAFGVIHGDLAADAGVHLRQERGRDLHERDAAHEGRGGETRDIAHQSAADGDDSAAALGFHIDQPVVEVGDGLQGLADFSARDLQHVCLVTRLLERAAHAGRRRVRARWGR